MRDDRWPKRQVVIDEDANAEEMEVSLSIREMREAASIDFSKRIDVEPWVRVRQAEDLLLSCGVNIAPEEEDQA